MSNARASAATQRPQTRTPSSVKSTPPKPLAVKQPLKSPSASSKPQPSASKPTHPKNPPAGNPSNRPASKPTVPKGPVKPPQRSQPQREGNWLNQTVQNSVAGVGNYAGGFINSIGASVKKIGEGVGNQIANTTRYWGQGVAGYGNNIKDSVGVGGPRIPTGGNPLGLAGQGSSQTTQTGAKPVQAVRSKGKTGAANPLGLSEP